MPTLEQLMKSAGINDPHQRANLIRELRGAAAHFGSSQESDCCIPRYGRG